MITVQVSSHTLTHIHAHAGGPTHILGYGQILYIDPLGSRWLYLGHNRGRHRNGVIQRTKQTIWSSGIVVYSLQESRELRKHLLNVGGCGWLTKTAERCEDGIFQTQNSNGTTGSLCGGVGLLHKGVPLQQLAR